jgi:hypothetical protein
MRRLVLWFTADNYREVVSGARAVGEDLGELCGRVCLNLARNHLSHDPHQTPEAGEPER